MTDYLILFAILLAAVAFVLFVVLPLGRWFRNKLHPVDEPTMETTIAVSRTSDFNIGDVIRYPDGGETVITGVNGYTNTVTVGRLPTCGLSPDEPMVIIPRAETP